MKYDEFGRPLNKLFDKHTQGHRARLPRYDNNHHWQEGQGTRPYQGHPDFNTSPRPYRQNGPHGQEPNRFHMHKMDDQQTRSSDFESREYESPYAQEHVGPDHRGYIRDGGPIGREIERPYRHQYPGGKDTKQGFYRRTSSVVPWKTIGFITLYVLTVLALTIPLGIFSKKATSLIPPCTEVTMGSTMHFPQLDFSLASQELAQKFCTDLSSSFPSNISVNECGHNNDKCDVTKFRSGSLNIDFTWKGRFKMSEEKVKKNKEKIKRTFLKALGLAVYNGKNDPNRDNLFKNDAVPMNVDMANTGTLAQCPSVYIPDGASVVKRFQGASYAGDQIQIKCDPGYRIPGNLIHQTLSCGSSGTWNMEVVPCEVQFCPEVTNVEHREILTGNATHSILGDELVTRCQEGYSLDTSDYLDIVAVIKCLENGDWDISLPTCQVLKCPDVTLPMNTTLTAGNLTDNTFSDTVTLECPDGFKFQSGVTAQTWTCTNTGQWNKEIEGCQYINGIWSTWTDWGDCQSNCSVEVINRTRVCNNPPGVVTVSEVQYLCEGEDIEYKNCTIDDKCISIYAAFTTKHENVASDTDIVFDEVLVDRTNHFSDGHFFTAPKTGEYLISLSGGVINQPLKIQITKDDDSGIGAIDLRNPRTNNYDIVSRDVLIHLAEGTRIRVVLLSGKSTDGYLKQRLTSITIFSYTGLMKEGGVAFSAGFTTPDTDGITVDTGLFTGITPQITVPMGGSGYNEVDGSFLAPRAGIYFFSVSVVGDKIVHILIDCDGVCGEYDTNLKLRGMDYDDYSLSRSVLLDLDTNDKITPINIYRGIEPFVGSENIETSFSGFLYEPVGGERVAFFAYKAEFQYDFYESVNPIPFSHEIVNEGGDLRKSVFVCRVSGLYFFHFSGGASYSGYKLNQYWLMQNDIEMAGVIHDLDKEAGTVLARSLILDLKAGDMVYLKTGEKVYAYSAGFEYGYIAFVGMLLQ